MVSDKAKRVKKELEQIKRIQTIKDVIDKNSSENLLLYTSSRENESLSDDVVDTMLNQMSGGKESDRNIKVVENLTDASSTPDLARRRQPSASAARKIASKKRVRRFSAHKKARKTNRIKKLRADKHRHAARRVSRKSRRLRAGRKR